MSKEEGKDEVKSPCFKKCSLDRNKIRPARYRSIDKIVSWRDAEHQYACAKIRMIY
jgi:predicted Fe-S protein YdhL (DUF1289 family)